MITPGDGMQISADVRFAPGVYYLPNGIDVRADNITIDGGGALLVGAAGAAAAYGLKAGAASQSAIYAWPNIITALSPATAHNSRSTHVRSAPPTRSRRTVYFSTSGVRPHKPMAARSCSIGLAIRKSPRTICNISRTACSATPASASRSAQTRPITTAASGFISSQPATR